MSKNVYAVTEIVGTSDQSISDAIQTAITKASESLRNLDWFEVESIRGKIRDGKASEYQVTMKLGFKYDR
jgi:flavin-binding protein dodecin